MSRCPAPPARLRGFSLVEVMVAVICGLLLLATLLLFAVHSVRNNAELVTATRLTQELRAAMDFTTRELRRAGHDRDALAQVLRPAGAPIVAAFAPIFLAPGGQCALYAYDRAQGSPGRLDAGNGELRGVRRVEANGVGVVEVAISNGEHGAPRCQDAPADYATTPSRCSGAWCALTDPRALDVTEFAIRDAHPANLAGAAGAGGVPVQLREFEVRIVARPAGGPVLERGLVSRVRVRADCARSGAAPGACAGVPAS